MVIAFLLKTDFNLFSREPRDLIFVCFYEIVFLAFSVSSVLQILIAAVI